MRSRLALVAAAGLLAGCQESAPAEPWPEPSLLPPVEGPRLVVTNSGDDSLSFLDPISFTEIARIPVGLFPMELEGAHHVAVTPDGRHLFVGISNALPPGAVGGGPHGSHGAGTSDGYVLRIDAVTGRQTGRLRVDRSPGDVRLQPGGKRVWLSHYDLTTIAEVLQRGGSYEETFSAAVVVDVETMTRVARVPVCPAGHGIGFSPDGGKAYVSCSWSDEVAIVDTATFAVERVPVAPDAGELTQARYEPYALAVAPDGRIWVSNTTMAHPANRGVRVIDPVAREEIPALALRTEGVPYFGSFLADNSRYFLVTQGPDALLAIDPADASVQQTVDLGALGCLNAHAAVLAPDERELWVVCEGDRLVGAGTVERFSLPDLAHTGQVSVGIYPDDVAFVPEVR